MSGSFPNEAVPPTETTVLIKGVCPRDGHLLVEVGGETMHLIPGCEASAWTRAQRYIADGHAEEAVAEAERILRAATGG